MTGVAMAKTTANVRKAAEAAKDADAGAAEGVLAVVLMIRIPAHC
jgi:hypothetical protein